ncbi:putative S-layer protein [Lactobacillus kullabergensis]|uniref:Putative S-layer protein n=1 Tax=Lactobacillus kullabergensis TaxID=1218493 RepID=A0A0F4LBA8_9LACO|nr:SLAP domain-containing protein [Lactobacillus kullabergensis]KJY55905.1 putative S-layer protein [Lactobacillus kullabergensis]
MLSKNNYNEKLRKMKLQARQDHFSIRKLTIGVASVLLGYAFFGAGSQTVKADTESTAQQADAKTESVSDKPHVNDNVVKLGSSKNTGTDGDKKNAASTSSVQKSAPDNTVSGVQTDVAKKADTDQVAKNGLTKEHLKKDGSDQGDIESVRNNRKFDITSTIQTVQIRVNNAYSSSSKDQDDLNTKNDYLAQIDKIDTDVIAKLNAGKNVEEIDSTAETAIRDILNLAAAAELHFAKKTTIDAITSKANVDEQAKLAASKANSHANINSAANAAKNQILEAYSKLSTTNRTETGKKCVAALDDIEATATEANDQIDKADDANSITNIVKTAVDKFFKTVDKAKIAFATALAKDLVGEGADKVSDSLSSQADKDLVNEILSQADTDFATADSLQKVFEITSKAIRDIDAVKSDALNKLNQYKLAASKKLGDVQFCDNEDIDGLPNISAENKSTLKDKVNLYYQTAISNIENAVDFDQVDKEENAGHLNMGRVVVDAQNLNKKIASDQKQLDDHTQKATENINNSNLSEADKEKAIEAIGQARDDAKNIVGQQPTVERADAAEKAGEATIDAIEQAAYLTDLERAKLIEKIRVENAAENAKNKVEDEFNHLDTSGLDKEKDKLETALETIEKVKNDAETAVSSATDKNAVSTISKTGIDKINGVADDTSLEFAKEAAKEIIQQISDIVKQNLKDPKDRNAVDEIIKETTVDLAKTIHDVTKIREYIIDGIKQIKNTADNKENNDLSNAKSSSKDTVNVDASAALDRVKKAYEKLTEAERTAKKDEYDTAIKAINDARTAAEDKIDNATNVDAIIAAVSNAKQNFNTIATNAEVSFAKLAGKDKIQDAAAEANKVLSPKGQAAVTEIVTQANSDIEDSETVAKIEKITENAINKIKALQDSEKTDLENAIRYANDEFEKKYKAAVVRLKKAFTDSATTTEVDKAFNSNKDITGKSVEEVNAKEIAAERELAKGEVRDTGTNAKTRVDSLKHKDDTDYTDNEKKALKNQIEKDVLEANGSKDQSGTLDKPSDTEGIDTVRNEAVNKIISESIADSQEGENVLQHDPDVLLERLAKAHKAAIDKLQKFGPTVNHDQTDKNYEDAKKDLSSNPTDLATELAGEKLIANGALSDAKTAADNIVDSNTDYSSTVKDKIKQQIQKDFDEATNRIKESPAVSELITQKRNDGIDQLHRDATDTNVNVTNIINSGGGSNQITNITNTNPDNNQNNLTPNTPEKNQEIAKKVRVVLNHNAYLYDNSTHRANGIILGISSILETIGTETINNRQYYVLVDQGANGKKYYVAAGNVKGTAKQLHNNAYIYNQYGKRVRKYGKLKAGKAVRTYGSSVKIRGKKYYIVAKNRFVKAANFTSHKAKTTVKKAKEVAAVDAADQSQVIINKKVMHNAYLYDENGVRANGLVINAGSTIDVSTQKVINKRVYYALENGLYIAAGNIDAKKLKLKHNAYVYSKYGNRLGKKVLKKHKSVNTYGTPVRIKGKKYYTVTTSKFVKKANVKG